MGLHRRQLAWTSACPHALEREESAAQDSACPRTTAGRCQADLGQLGFEDWYTWVAIPMLLPPSLCVLGQLTSPL